MAGFGDYAVAAKFKEMVVGIVKEVLNDERPRQAYAIVDYFTINESGGIAVMVKYVESIEAPSVMVALGSVVPTRVGQTVIIDGPRNLRRVVAVIGDAVTETGVIPFFDVTYIGGGSSPTLPNGSGMYVPSFSSVDSGLDTYGIINMATGTVDIRSLPGRWMVGMSVEAYPDSGGPTGDILLQARIVGVASPAASVRSFVSSGGVVLPRLDTSGFANVSANGRFLNHYEGATTPTGIRAGITMYGPVGANVRLYTVRLWGFRFDTTRY